MTDFRGLIPCIHVLANLSAHDPLMMMIVHCQRDKQATKASFRVAQCEGCPVLQDRNCVHVTTASPSAAWQELTQQWCMPSGFPQAFSHDSDSEASCDKMSHDGTSPISKQEWEGLVPAHVETSLNDDPYIKSLMLTMPQHELNNSSQDALHVGYSY
eukprot:CAMPEP_0172662174 /NCGR_PEP_ID=MMETSP1074-20121228/5197_1 /TAXON_ID=2916 /ORGANISM="Ceratium fusus, Strain PA161109" /LENGTH=156 /DNA_ID=CAMNT_0013478051 /DNA_START=256 /DNA_END=726 /DNA_ORIENTATION=-